MGFSRVARLGGLLAMGLLSLTSAEAQPRKAAGRTANASRGSAISGVRGITVGPIENAYHPGNGYGSDPYRRTLAEARQMGARWVALTPFGRVGSLEGHGVDPSFEAPFEENKKAVARAIQDAHARGLSVMLVPHLWVESGEWRALIDPKTDAGWRRWSESYGAFLKGWAKVAAENQVDLLSVGVELRSWVTSARAPSFSALIHDVRVIYNGPLTYSANWDDVTDTIILGDVDVVGINAFYPLAEKEGASLGTLREGGERVRARVQKLAADWQKPVLFTEIGYTTRKDPAVKPWEWPDAMKNVAVDQQAQADAYAGLLGPLLEEPKFAGFFVWRVYADPDDVSQEAEWGFSPRGKVSELVMRDAFGARWASEADTLLPFASRARVPGLYPGPSTF